MNMIVLCKVINTTLIPNVFVNSPGRDERLENDVGYLGSGFEYFSDGFAPKLAPTEIPLAPSRAQRALSESLLLFPKSCCILEKS